MAPPKKGRSDDLKQEEILQAVVIADSFDVRFGPVTDKKPRALLPVVSVPLLDYTLEFLATQGVQEAFIFCSHLSQQIREHINDIFQPIHESSEVELKAKGVSRKTRWREESKDMTVKVILAEGSSSMGDAMREMHSRSLIRNDFFLLNCDTIANVNLKELMRDHKARRQKMKMSVMTMTCMKTLPSDPIRCAEDSITMTLRTDTNQVLDYQKVPDCRKFKIPLNMDDRITAHQDLMDGQLYVCSPDVLTLFTDNFDYCTMDNFIRGVIVNEDVLGNTVHVNVLKNQYCARITNPYMYGIVSQHLVALRTLPLNLNRFVLHDEDQMVCRGKNVYIGKGASIHIDGYKQIYNTALCKGSTVGANCIIRNSTIGPDCHIGDNVKMYNCHLWTGVRIEDGCELNNAILCDGVTVLANTTVQPHTILSWNVTVGPDITLPPGIRLQDTPQKDEFDDEEEEQPIPEVTPEYGSRSKAFLFKADSDSDDEDEDDADWGEALADALRRGHEDDDDVCRNFRLETSEEEEVDEYGNFCSELTATLTRAKEEKINLENLILEVNSLKHAYNIVIKEVHHAVVKVLVEMPLNNNPNAQGKELITAVLRHLETHKGLLKHYIRDKEAQLDCLYCLEDFAVDNDRMLSVLSKVVQYLYNKDILEEYVITKWYHKDAVEDEEEEHEKIRKQMEEFVNWLEEAEEESGNSED